MASAGRENEIIPQQTHGRQSGARAERETKDQSLALAKYDRAKIRLMNVELWEKYGGKASFKLFNYAGDPVSRLARKGDFIRIDLPGPGPRAGRGYDWVHIEEMQDEVDEKNDTASFAFRVRPAAGPASKKNETAHFFTSDATSTFMVQRKGNRVIAEEFGRNENSNTQAQRITDKVRNAVVAVAASYGAAHLQWQDMLEGILGD